MPTIADAFNTPEARAALRRLHEAEQEALVPPELKAQGWVYRDMPGRCTPDAWKLLLSIIGDGNYRILIMSQGRADDGPWVRGQMVISPLGMENMQKHLAEKAAANAAK